MAAFRSVSQTYGYGVTSVAVTPPAGAAAGDLLIAYRSTQSTSTYGAPAGWTSLGTVTTTGNTLAVHWMRLTAVPPASWSFPASSGSDNLIHIVAVSNPHPTLAPVYAGRRNDDLAAPSVTPPTSSGGLLVCVAGALYGGVPSGGWTPPAGMTERADAVGVSGAYASQTVATQDIPSGAATGTRTFSDAGVTPLATPQLASVLVPAPDVTAPVLRLRGLSGAVLKSIGGAVLRDITATNTAPDPPAATNAAFYGIAEPWGSVQDLTTAQTDTYMAQMAATGATWWRTDLRVFELEATQGNRTWTAVDRVVTSAKNAGMKVLLVPTGVPAWARAGSPSTWQRGAITTAEQDAFAAFCAAAVARYQQVDAWEVWNEPNYSQFWSPTPSATTYRTLMQKVYEACRPLAPVGVPILTGGTAVVGTRANAFWADFYAAGGGPYCDGICMHPYPNVGWSRAGQFFTGTEMEDVAAVRATMNAAGDTTKPIWATENGMPTPPMWSPPVTEAEQAAWLPAIWSGWANQATARGKTGPSFLYQYADQDSSDAVDAEAHFGIVRSTGVLKPGHGAMKTWAQSAD